MPRLVELHGFIVLNLIPLSVTKAFPCHCKSAKFFAFHSPSYYCAVLKNRYFRPWDGSDFCDSGDISDTGDGSDYCNSGDSWDYCDSGDSSNYCDSSDYCDSGDSWDYCDSGDSSDYSDIDIGDSNDYCDIGDNTVTLVTVYW